MPDYLYLQNSSFRAQEQITLVKISLGTQLASLSLCRMEGRFISLIRDWIMELGDVTTIYMTWPLCKAMFKDKFYIFYSKITF